MNPLTKEELKACKSLEPDNLFTSGWAKEGKITAFKLCVEITLVIGPVSMYIMYLLLHFTVLKKKKTLWPLFMDGIQLP